MRVGEAFCAFYKARTGPGYGFGRLDTDAEVADAHDRAGGWGDGGEVELDEDFAVEAAEGYDTCGWVSGCGVCGVEEE